MTFNHQDHSSFLISFINICLPSLTTTITALPLIYISTPSHFHIFQFYLYLFEPDMSVTCGTCGHGHLWYSPVTFGATGHSAMGLYGRDMSTHRSRQCGLSDQSPAVIPYNRDLLTHESRQYGPYTTATCSAKWLWRYEHYTAATSESTCRGHMALYDRNLWYIHHLDILCRDLYTQISRHFLHLYYILLRPICTDIVAIHVHHLNIFCHNHTHRCCGIHVIQLKNFAATYKHKYCSIFNSYSYQYTI